jgi:Family of unknown function (DUF5686)/CarboxypepD_reg-like domain
MRIFLFCLILISCQTVSAQKIYGTVFNSQGDLLPYASVTIKGTTKGASANDKAKYSLNLPNGTYTIVCNHLGFTTTEKKVTVNGETELSFVLTDQKLSMDAVIVKNGGEDPAYEVIRNAIKKRTFYAKQVNQFTCNIYGKDLIKLKSLPKKVFGKKIESNDKKEMGVDSAGKGIIYLSESVSKVSIAQPDKFKMEVISSRVSGSDGFGFNFPAFISLYSNNVKVFTEKFNPRGFISPIADGAIGFYKFKFLGTIFENGRTLSSIRVTPRRKYEPLFSGIINIVDDEWSIQSFDLILTKTAQLELVDTLQITQLHVPVDASIRRVKNQLIHFDFNQFGVKMGGNFLTVYSDYDVKPTFAKKYFDNVIIKYDTGVNKKSIAYWDSTRAVPLEKEEEQDYKKKDSAFKSNKDSLLSKRYLDSVNKSQRKIKPLDIVTRGIFRFHNTKTHSYSWRVEPLLDLLSPNVEYNPAEGVAVNLKASIAKFKRNSRTGLIFQPLIRYGFGNTHLNPSATLIVNTREQDSVTTKLKRYSIAFSGGKRVSEFNKETPFSVLGNSISTLFYGKNYMKTYENYFSSVSYRRRFESGLQLAASVLYEDRIPLDVTSDYTFKKDNGKNITPNYPYEKLTQQFDPHQAVIASFSLSYRPGQRYIQLPNYKMSVGSKYPTFTFNYTKGLNNILGSDVDFDKWKVTVFDDVNLKIAGALKYKFGIGGFLNNKQVFIQDYQHFNGNQIVSASEYVNSFQLAPYYANSTTERFYVFGHVEHHLNGLLTNKIPLFRKLNWNMVVGSNAFFVNKNNNYMEIFGGLENILKTIRVDAVVGYDRNNNISTGIRLGFGGLLGSSVSRSNGGVNISL